MSLPDAIKIDIRRHLGYPSMGDPARTPQGSTLMVSDFGFRFNATVPQLETIMETRHPIEEAKIIGLAVGAVKFSGLQPAAGDTVSLTFTGGGLGSPRTVPTVTAVTGDTSLTLLYEIAAAINQDSILQAAGFTANAPWGSNVFSASQVSNPEVAFMNPVPFSFAFVATGNTALAKTAYGGLLDPSALVNDNPSTTVYGYVPILNYLENAITGSTVNHDVSKAETFVHDGRETEKRQALYDSRVVTFGRFLGISVFRGRDNNRPGRRYV